jgi:UDP:flavonoid glycosyltransferase YjiC (YdhE family)
LNCNKPQAIIPHIGDQFYWNRAIEKQRLGIKGFPIKKWDINKFEELVKDLLNFKLSTNI